MRAQRERTKKLIVAFHFQFANQAGWRCGDCRKNGLEQARRCGWLTRDVRPARVVWARRSVAVDSCPISYVSAESSAWIQEFQVWKLFGGVDIYALPARTVEAFCILENESRAEMTSEQ